ncbi:hypothetical protein [Candidatus Avelusimicrobium fimicolum]|uniref:hypothetical protein n=1 Tax=Candidatus Avelusimicrobium fimicolum TaxID=3416216 RepID=UPI003D122FA1
MSRGVIAVFLCFLALGATAQAAPEPEIVIEMHGESFSPRQGISVWNKNAQQLTRLFRGKDKTYVLYQVENVSSADRIIRAKNGKRYAYVRYGSDDGDYRKFLFQAQDPQTFVACAADIADVLAINLKYGVNLGVSQRDFLRTYESRATLTNLLDKATNKTYSVYRLEYTDVNHPTPVPTYFVFEGDSLKDTLASEKAFTEYTTKLSQANKALAKQEKETQTAWEQAGQQARQKKQRPTRKALVSGGTVTDQAYMPRAVNATPLPALTPSKIPAGTPLN